MRRKPVIFSLGEHGDETLMGLLHPQMTRGFERLGYQTSAVHYKFTAEQIGRMKEIQRLLRQENDPRKRKILEAEYRKSLRHEEGSRAGYLLTQTNPNAIVVSLHAEDNQGVPIDVLRERLEHMHRNGQQQLMSVDYYFSPLFALENKQLEPVFFLTGPARAHWLPQHLRKTMPKNRIVVEVRSPHSNGTSTANAFTPAHRKLLAEYIVGQLHKIIQSRSERPVNRNVLAP